MARTVMLCDCAGSQRIDRDRLAAATGLDLSPVCTALCTAERDRLAAALAGGEVAVACRQEAPAFAEVAAEAGLAAPATVDIRDRAGWTGDAADPAPKMAALLAEAALPAPQTPVVDVESAGLCLILGPAEAALAAAELLKPHLAVTVLVPEADPLPGAPVRDVDVVAGRVRSATGAFGGFEIVIDALRRIEPAGRGELRFGAPRDGGRTRCDVVLDLSGGRPLFPAPEKRDGYLRADPGDPAAVARAALAASHLAGSFEKPLHIRFEASLCAHSRAGQPACSRCLDLCPTGAITPAGETVAIDPMICAGCGACAAVCPSGAAAYDDPPVGHLFLRLRTLAETYRAAGGGAPRLLVHDAEWGREMIALAARHDRGLPADLVPFELSEIAVFGHAETMAALGLGFAEVVLLAGPRAERDAILPQIALARALAGREDAVRLVDPADPTDLPDAVWDGPAAPEVEPMLPLGGRRDAVRLAVRALRPGAEAPIPLPEGAPYGAVLVDAEACTLCHACASLCPPGALGDDPDAPKLTFKEDACIQCGLCANVCPEDAITLVPRLDPSDAALRERVMKEEEPYHCIECGRPFGVKSTIERIVAQLEGRHALFTGSDNARLIRMCDDCRVRAQYHSEAQPFAAGPRPRPRTTDDYSRNN